ncbi:MAG: nucleotidyltransferase domain-containing protein [Firmicutes bacterium]|nr:nucleotidyltransferase domain-containing protein [Bacillota bacterium]
MGSTGKSPGWYRETYPLLFERVHAKNEELDRRFDQGWTWAKKVADLLRDSFSAQRVVVFGSLTDRKAFHRYSDIDIAAWGIPTEHYYAAVGAITALVRDFDIDLVTPDTSAISDTLRQAIERDGVEI